MKIKVLFFGLVKDVTGKSEETLELQEGASLGDVFDHYAEIHPRLKPLSASILLAANHDFSPRSRKLAEDDEVAFLPPVSGGSGPFTHEIVDEAGHFFALTRERIDVGALRGRLLEGRDGAVVVFEGVVRNNSGGRRTLYLDYECYEAMAIKVLARIGREIAGSHEISRIAMVHRLGRMEIGEASVVVMVTSPHRKPAFDAALEGINRLKKTAPIWKKEYFEDGAVWVEGDWDSSLAGR
ncbi:MAG: molybdenum cofactor biosynthesis protein MoaE [Bryobacteraceae bacterium]|nr:molybdenum cofactor biosynthesis protein MoaE [Bryobacteraceae bacterium]